MWTMEKLKREFHVHPMKNYEAYVEGWNLIGDKYEINQGWMIIDTDLYNMIKEKYKGVLSRDFFSYKSKYDVLSRDQWEELERKCAHKKKKEKKPKGGIYGIYKNGKLVYIGKTARNFEARWNEHLAIMKGEMPKPAGMILYDNIDIKRDKVEFRVLLDVSQVLVDGKFLPRDLNAAELTLISLFKPKYNIVGLKKPYNLEE